MVSRCLYIAIGLFGYCSCGNRALNCPGYVRVFRERTDELERMDIVCLYLFAWSARRNAGDTISLKFGSEPFERVAPRPRAGEGLMLEAGSWYAHREHHYDGFTSVDWKAIQCPTCRNTSLDNQTMYSLSEKKAKLGCQARPSHGSGAAVPPGKSLVSYSIFRQSRGRLLAADVGLYIVRPSQTGNNYSDSRGKKEACGG